MRKASELVAMIAAFATAGPLPAQDERARDEQVLRDANLKNDGSALLQFMRDRTPDEQLRSKILKLVKQCGDKSFQARRKAAEELQQIGLPAVAILRQSLNDPDPEIVRACTRVLAVIEKTPSDAVAAAAARMLGRLKPGGTVELLLSQIPNAEGEVGDALRWSLAQVALAGDKPEPKLVAALKDESAARRGAAGEALITAGAKATEPEVRKLLDDANAEVRLRVALALVAVARDKSVVPKLIELLPKAPPSLAWRAGDLLDGLSNGDGPRVSLTGNAEQREECRKAWAEWWTANAGQVKMERLDAQPKEIGYTLVLEIDPNRRGKAIEFAQDGKTIRWQIDGLSMPVDAQVLPRTNRVLIAEYSANRVTERDYQGQVHWTKQVTMPVACQRLPDGGTFIGYRRGLVEYDAKGAEVFRHDFGRSTIVAAQKARDGSYMFLTRMGELTHLDNKGKVIKTFATNRTYGYSSLELLPNNRVLLAHLSGVSEYDLATEKQVWNANVRAPVSVAQLANGGKLAASLLQRRIIELDRDGKVVKEFALPDGGVPYRVKRR